MSALAKCLFHYGYKVSGSDRYRGEQTESLVSLGIDVYIGEEKNRAALLEADAVVYTDAIPFCNKELSQARAMGKRLYSRADFLAKLCEGFQTVIAVGGSHGKTTCTSMCAHVLKGIGVPFTAHIGGEDSTFGNFYSDGLDYFVTEACEYKKNLLKIHANRAILLNVDNDHMECYKDEADLLHCFQQYCLQSETAFVCADDERCGLLGDFPSFGIRNVLADYRAVDLRANKERYAFTVEEYGRALCRIQLKAIGRCNVYNALAAFAVMRSLGFEKTEIKKGLEEFSAVRRRFERIGGYRGASFICDYAHHPKEIAATVQTAKGICQGRLYVVFQPHTYSRTRLLFTEFVSVLKKIDNLMLYKTYAAREHFDGAGSAQTLSVALKNSLYAENVYALKTWIKKTVKSGDVVLFLGAGDIYYAAQYLLKVLQ